jgi:hypothetical protein
MREPSVLLLFRLVAVQEGAAPPEARRLAAGGGGQQAKSISLRLSPAQLQAFFPTLPSHAPPHSPRILLPPPLLLVVGPDGHGTWHANPSVCPLPLPSCLQ